ncbi:hypothetical protein [Saccharothrix longispora]|uniref:hypothetical protein n=1 Tax=Saccharothrix longispora TaxID=33920 RepID=UPI0028FD1791|nr:hypothetical protein [Saccharothrix longispora]MDU0289717.1 hypothetical protein [Saccharothrix longispora]
MDVRVLADTAGRLPWTSPALLGSTHDLTVARAYGITDTDIRAGADKTYKASAIRSAPSHRDK